MSPRRTAAATYRRHDPTHTALYRTIETHLGTFLAETAEGVERSGVPVFVKREFETYLRCGVLDHGFARARCAACGYEHLVPFSCKGRGFCPSCGGRRMTAHAAHLVEAVLPRVPVRQRVLTLPYRLRYRLAWDHRLARAVLGVYARVLQDFYVRGAHRRGIGRGRTGMRRSDRRPDLAHRALIPPPGLPGAPPGAPSGAPDPRRDARGDPRAGEAGVRRRGQKALVLPPP